MELKNIDLTNKDNFLKAKDINLGFSARQYMTKLKKSENDFEQKSSFLHERMYHLYFYNCMTDVRYESLSICNCKKCYCSVFCIC